MDYKKRCADCACLIEVNKTWCCDECFGQKCEDITDCPEDIEVAEVEKANSVKAPKVGARSSEQKERKPREKKIDTDKQWLITTVRDCLNVYTCKGIETLVVANDQREITFDYNGANYSLVLTKHRK